MGNAFGCLPLSDLEKASSSEVGLFVGKVGPEYNRYEKLIVRNAFNGAYIKFKYRSNVNDLTTYLHYLLSLN
jgi:hypothetical protein